MKLYYSPGACSLVPHILLREAGLSFELERVDLRSKQTASGVDFNTVNPKGYVPALVLDNGELLTEVQSIAQYIADQAPQAGLLPAVGEMDRYRVLEWMNYVSGEIHKTFGIMFNPHMPEEAKTVALKLLERRLAYVDERLKGSSGYLVGDSFSVADAYLFTTAGWGAFFKLDMSRWPALQAYVERVRQRPAVLAALKEEGLLSG